MHDHTPKFLTAMCVHCEGRVLASRVLCGEADLAWACMHCEAILDESDSLVSWVAPHELARLGYFVDGFEVSASPTQKGGCRDGQCGVRQPL